MPRAKPKPVAVAGDVDQVQGMLAAAFAAVVDGGLFPEGVGTIEVKVTVGGAEVSVRAAAVGLRSAGHFGVTFARTPRDAAAEVLAHGSIELFDFHSSGNQDAATALKNVVDTSNGMPAQRSSYDGAPGGTVPLGLAMLEGMLTLARTYTLGISEVAGGKHSPTSRHYVGVAFDVAKINGALVNGSHPEFKALMAAARSAGATEVLGPGDAGHDTHVHAAWPRPLATSFSEGPTESYCESPAQ